MRVLGLLSMTALILTGLPPSPPAPAAAAVQRGERIVRGEDPDARCAPFLQGGAYYDDSAGYGRGRGRQSVGGMVSPPSPPYTTNSQAQRSAPPPPPPPPPSYAPQQRAETQVMTNGSRIAQPPGSPYYPAPQENRERYAGRDVAAVQSVAEQPVSTFAVDVDTGSYANVRRMLNQGQMPPQAAVRTEEMLNYFRYDYPAPTDRSRPFTVNTDMTTTPWNRESRLLRIGLRGYDLPRRDRPAINVVFLVDVSGSMNQPDKLPLVQCSLALLADRLTPRDKVAIVVYAGAAGVVLDPTNSRDQVVEAIKRLRAGGSTAGAQGIRLAYDVARRSMVDGGINRVILATDGDFNVGLTNNDALVDMVEREREAGITLTTLGFGTGNYNEAMMEQIADHGNGNYAYIDSPREAQKVLDQELSSTLFTIAHDVKIQVEFNPAYVAEYRLIGYENRALREEDFDNDAVDAGDIGAGHQVTALYEIVPTGSPGWLPNRRYEENRRPAAGGYGNGELAFLRLRYKLPGQDTSRLIEQPVHASLLSTARAPTGDTAFVAAVAAYGQLLRGDANLNGFTFADARRLAEGTAGWNYWRREFVGLTQLAERRQYAEGGGKPGLE
jgi:Ca-activated chloride channel family protein